MSFIEKFNTDIEFLKSEIENLFIRSKKQYSTLLMKTNSSFVELMNIFRRNEDLEDTFVDGEQIESTNGLVFDKSGWTNAFNIEEVRFRKDYYIEAGQPGMVMEEGRPVPGSKFTDIFKDNEGFWGLMRDDSVNVPSSFSIDFQDVDSGVNRIYLRTNSVVDVEAVCITTNQQRISLGKLGGQHHIWSVPPDNEYISVEFIAKTSIFVVSFLAAGRANYVRSGTFISTLYSVDDLRNLTVDTTKTVPDGCAIRQFVYLTDGSTVPEADDTAWESWDETNRILLTSTETKEVVTSGYIIPSGFIDESLSIRTGYNEWDDVSETDYAPVVQTIDVPSAGGALTLPVGYKVITNGVTAVRVGEEEFELAQDFTVEYDVDASTIDINLITKEAGGRLDSHTGSIEADVLLRMPVSVSQRRTFVYLETARTISLSITESDLSVRNLYINDNGVEVGTTETPPIGTYDIEGHVGLNLIEIEGITGSPPTFVGSYTYFASRYRQKRVFTNDPGTNEFYLESVSGGMKLVSGADSLYVRYLVSTGLYNNVAVKFEFEAVPDAAPQLYSYRLINEVDRT